MLFYRFRTSFILGIVICLQLPANLAFANQLEGKIEHVQELAPVSPDLNVGDNFDEKKLRPAHPASAAMWWRVPAWLAGCWKNVGKVRQLSLTNLQTKETYATEGAMPIFYADQEVIGVQHDRSGDVWTTVPVPYLSRDRVGKHLNINRVDLVEPLQVADDQVVLRLLATTFMVDMWTNKIVSISQREAFQTYRPVQAGRVIVLASMKFFDEHGKSKFSRDLLTHCRREAAYRELQYWTGPGTGLAIIDLRKSFDDFLKDHHMENLIPDRAKLAHN